MGRIPQAEIAGVLSTNIYTAQHGSESDSGSVGRTIMTTYPFPSQDKFCVETDQYLISGASIAQCFTDKNEIIIHFRLCDKVCRLKKSFVTNKIYRQVANLKKNMNK